MGGVNTELTLSTGATGLVEKPKRSFTDVLEGFCNKGLKKKKRKSLFIYNIMQVWTGMCGKSERVHTKTHTYLRSDTGILGGLRDDREKGSQAIFDRLL